MPWAGSLDIVQNQISRHKEDGEITLAASKNQKIIREMLGFKYYSSLFWLHCWYKTPKSHLTSVKHTSWKPQQRSVSSIQNRLNCTTEFRCTLGCGEHVLLHREKRKRNQVRTVKHFVAAQIRPPDQVGAATSLQMH